MNFLSHAWVLGPDAPPLVYLGAALPDLWPHLSMRPLPKLVLDRLRAGDDGDGHVLAHGIAHHLQADAAFHRHPIFSRRVSLVAERAEPLLAESRWSTVFAHVLVEMLLDRWLIEGDPGLLDRYYGHFGQHARERAATLASDRDEMRRELATLLDRFVELRFLADYTRSAGLAFRLVRTLGRVAVNLVADDRMDPLAALVADLHVELAPGSEELLGDVARAVEEKLPPPPAVSLRAAS